MTTRMTINGVSTCTAGEKYEKFQLKIGLPTENRAQSPHDVPI